MTVAQAVTAMTDLTTAIGASDIDAADLKANTSSSVAAAIALSLALMNLIAGAGYGPRHQPYKGPLYP